MSSVHATPRDGIWTKAIAKNVHKLPIMPIHIHTKRWPPHYCDGRCFAVNCGIESWLSQQRFNWTPSRRSPLQAWINHLGTAEDHTKGFSANIEIDSRFWRLISRSFHCLSHTSLNANPSSFRFSSSATEAEIASWAENLFISRHVCVYTRLSLMAYIIGAVLCESTAAAESLSLLIGLCDMHENARRLNWIWASPLMIDFGKSRERVNVDGSRWMSSYKNLETH